MSIWPQITYLVLMTLGLGLVWGKHGQPQSNYNVFTHLIAVMIGVVVLYYGGFFTPLGYAP